MRLVGQGYIYIYVGGVRSEYGIEPMGPIRGGGRAYPHLSPNQMHGWEFEEEGRRGWLPEEPYERIYLGKRQVGQLHQKTIIARLLLLLFLWEMIARFSFFIFFIFFYFTNMQDAKMIACLTESLFGYRLLLKTKNTVSK